MKEGFFHHVKIRGRGNEGVDVSHLLFADDTLIFCKTSKDHMTHLCWLLIWFEAISGLKIDLDKSEICLVGEGEDPEDLAIEIGCKVGRLPSTELLSHW